MLTGHGVHELPIGELPLQLVAVGEDDIKLLVLVELAFRRRDEHTHLFCLGSPFLLYPGGSTVRDETIVRAALVKKFYEESACLLLGADRDGSYLDDLVDFLVLLLVCFGQWLAARHGLAL